jgi:adenylate cyclase
VLPRTTATTTEGADDAALRALLDDAEFDAERTIAWTRIAIALTLAGGVWLAAPWIIGTAGHADSTRRLLIAGGTIGGFLALGVASLITVMMRYQSRWLPFLSAAGDAALISTSLWFTLHVQELSGNWLAALPAVLVVPLMLSVGTLRYRPSVQVWATVCFAAGLMAVAVARVAGDAGPPPEPTAVSAITVAPFFTPPANAMRLLLVALIGATTAYVVLRARRLLMRASAETLYRANLSRFLPHDVAPLVAPGADDVWRRGRRQRVAIMFVDLRDSTKIAEDMDPSQLSVFISSFRRRVTRAAKAYPGVIDKFIGDGALIVFGVPEARADDAERAVRCGREILRLVASWNAKRKFDPPVRVGVGIHIGETYCGIVGDEDRLEFTVLGDTVNVAARIEQATKEFNEPLLVSEPVAREAGAANQWREVAREPLRGRLQPLRIFAPQP